MSETRNKKSYKYSEAREKLVHYFDNMSEDEIAKKIGGYPEDVRNKAYGIILSAGNEEGANKFNIANQMVIKNKFLESLENGSYNDYLSLVSLPNKYNLLISMGFFNTELSEEERKLIEEIEHSIEEEIKDNKMSKILR